MPSSEPMAPLGTVSLAATTTSGRVALAPPASRCIVTCPSSNADIVYVTFGDGNVVATSANGVPCLPGSIQTFSVGGVSDAAAICPTSTGTAYFTTGEGI